MKANALPADEKRKIVSVAYDEPDGSHRTAYITTRENRHADRIVEAINNPGAVNQSATFAATEARGPRCDRCESWTFRPEYNRLPYFVARLCPKCLPLNPDLMSMKSLALSQIFKRDLEGFIRYPADQPIEL